MNLDELMAEIIRACPYPMEGKHIVGQKDYGIQLRNAIRGVLEPEWEKLHGRISGSVSAEIKAGSDAQSHYQENLNFRGYLSLLLTWIETGIPEKEPDHICGTDASCDQNCVTFAEFCRDVSQAKKAISYKMISIDASDFAPLDMVADMAEFKQYYYVSVKSDGPKEGWSKVCHRHIGHVYRIEEIDWGKKYPIRLNCSSVIWWSPDDLTPEETR